MNNKRELSNTWTAYRIQIRDRAFVALDETGSDWLDVDELQELISGLQFTLRMMEAGSSVEQIIHTAAISCLHEIMYSAGWIDTFTLPLFEYCEDSKGHPIESGTCVYFLKHPEFDDRIKIGRTQNLYNRMRDHWLMWQKRMRPKLLAVIQTQHHKQLERVLHIHFADWQIEGEWFQGKAVTRWLDDTRAMTDEY